MNHFIVDAETDGLYGSFLSVAALVTTSEGEQADLFYGAVSPDLLQVRSEWVKKNVLPYISAAHTFFSSEDELLRAFWDFWMKHRETSVCIADVCYPVEARLFSRCVQMSPEEREFQGPFPLLDLSTLLLARGIPVDTSRKELTSLSLVQHDALNDARITEDIWRKLMKG